MLVKLSTSGPRQYVNLVKASRDAAGVPRQRVIATLGRLESIRAGAADALLDGLLRASGKPTLEQGTGALDFAPARCLGDSWRLTALWKELGFAEAFRRVLRNRHQFDLAVPVRRHGEFDHLLAEFNPRACQAATEETVGELAWQGFRLIVAHRPDVTQEQGGVRDARIAALEADAARWAGKLDGQEAGRRYRGKKLSDAGTTARCYSCFGG